ncbi:MAG: hypothetical protein GY949_06945 [Gammaproteobacteria bacterium]|nr:hypothetical protein [Gammaproteobacteria bacterium]
MKFTKRLKTFCAISFVCAALTGCASTPELIARSAAVPEDTDLSGLWQFRVEPGAKPMPRADGEQQILIPPAQSTRNRARRSTRRSSGPSVHVFLETGNSLKVTQTREGLFISFDRAVVEEYTFGENRVVSVGPIEAQRVSGWQERKFVVETLDDEGNLLTETWRLEAGGMVLVRDIAVTRGNDQMFSSRQYFDRI